MKKSLLASLLIVTALDSFAVCGHSSVRDVAVYSIATPGSYADPYKEYCVATSNPPSNGTYREPRANFAPTVEHYFQISTPTASEELNLWGVIVPKVCPSGQAKNTYGYCSPIVLSSFNGNRQSCTDNGGWYADGLCGTKDQFYATIKQKKQNFLFGSTFRFGDVLVTKSGLYPLIGAIATLFPPAAVYSAGIHSFVGGAAYLAYNHNKEAINDTGSTALSNSVSTGGKTFKIDLVNYTPSSDPTTPENATGKIVTQTDQASGKVEKALYIPDPVIAQMENPDNVDFPNDSVSQPLDMTGSEEYIFDYQSDIVTKKSYTASQGDPVVTTAPINVSQNPDGTVTTSSIPSSGVPTVSGENGGSVVSPPNTINNYNGASSDTIASDQAALLSGIRSNTASTAASASQIAQNTSQTNSLLDDIKGMFVNDTAVDTSLSDGSDTFNSLGDTAKGSFSGFVYTDPLRINALGGSYAVPTYSFNLLGHNFVLFNEAMLNNLPLSLIQNLFMFIAAILAFVTVISGV